MPGLEPAAHQGAGGGWLEGAGHHQEGVLGDPGAVVPARQIAGADPLVLITSRGWWCPKEQRYLRELTRLQDEFEVAYTRIAVVSVDPPEVQSAFRAGLGARFTFLSDSERRWLGQLGFEETTDTTHNPYFPAGFTLFPDLTGECP